MRFFPAYTAYKGEGQPTVSTSMLGSLSGISGIFGGFGGIISPKYTPYITPPVPDRPRPSRG